MPESKPDTRRCGWECPLSDMGRAGEGGRVGYLIGERKVYCCCLDRDVGMGETCPVFPNKGFDLSQVMERYEPRKAKRGCPK